MDRGLRAASRIGVGSSMGEFLITAAWPVVVGAINLALWALLLYFTFRFVRSLSAAGRWRLAKILLTILFLPFVLLWTFMTAGSDCGCCCDEDD
jgi:hypothetical protein